MLVSAEKIRDALRAEDIEGLIELGAPSDEYDDEATQIAEAVAELPEGKVSAENIIAIIALIWAKSFDRSSDEIAKRLPAFSRVIQRLYVD
jgi:hypothetical protein